MKGNIELKLHNNNLKVIKVSNKEGA